MNTEITITATVNGKTVTVPVLPDETLAEMLRGRLRLTGTKISCGEGECGACTVLLDGRAVTSCIMLAADVDGREVLTVEGLAATGELDILQQSFIEAGAVQCGFCTPGMLMSAKGLLLENPSPTQQQIKEAMAGNLCRCTGYRSIVKAVKLAAQRLSEEKANA